MTLEVRGFYKRFADVIAVDGASFSAKDGEITGLLGPNGAGKTTTLRMLYGLLKPDRGEARIEGINPREDPAQARTQLGVLPDTRGLYERLTARENIAYFAALQGMADADVAPRIESLTQVLEMGEFIDRRTKGFSQGQRVKVAIARALVHDPKNVVLDEPTNGLDVMSTRSMRRFLRELAAEGRCVLFSSHIMQEVAAVTDRIVIIDGGRVIADGTHDEILERAGAHSLEDAFVSAVTEGLAQAQGGGQP